MKIPGATGLPEKVTGVPKTFTLCPYFQLSEDGADSVEHELEISHGSCTSCQRPLLLCPFCPGANRLMANHCRNCGKALPVLNWPIVSGSWDSALLTGEIGLPQSAQLCQLPPLNSHALLASGGALIQVGKEEQARVLFQDRVLASVPWLASAGTAISTCLLSGLLAVGFSERVQISDLVDLLELSPGSPTRRKSLPLRGQLAAPLASDGQNTLVALSRDQGRDHLQVFQTVGARLQLSWTRPLDEEETRSAWLSVNHNYLLLAREDGSLECYGLESGELLSALKLTTSLAFFPPLARQFQNRPSWLVAGSDGSLYRLYLQGQKLESYPLAPSCAGPVFGFGSDAQQVVVCHGKNLRRIDCVSGKIFELELPQYCTVAPWVQRNRALAISQEGTLYALSLGGSSFQVEHALRLPGNFQGATHPPLQLHGDLWLLDGDGLLIQVKLAATT